MLGEKIKALRSENALTQKDLAEKLYVTAQAVSRWENNEVEPSINTICFPTCSKTSRCAALVKLDVVMKMPLVTFFII